jgi:hypothetical protein
MSFLSKEILKKYFYNIKIYLLFSSLLESAAASSNFDFKIANVIKIASLK